MCIDEVCGFGLVGYCGCVFDFVGECIDLCN